MQPGFKPMPIGADGQKKGFGNKENFSDKWATMYGDTLSSSATPQDMNTFFKQGKRTRINLVAICVNVFLPWVMFTAVFMMVSFEFHHQRPALMFGILLGCLLFVLLLAYQAYAARESARTPMWWSFAAVFSAIALVLGFIGGDINYHYNLAPYYAITNLNSYPNIDVSTDSGAMLMDVGKAYFAPGTHLDFKKAMGFKQDDMYCVAPIMKGTGRMESYDYWAVGKNCCSGAMDFRCGEFNNPKARSGLRLMSDDSRAFYRLAVQQAEGAHKINAPHPLFFEWVQDPVATLDLMADRGWRIFVMAVVCFLGIDTLAVCIAIVAFSKLGHYPSHIPRAH